jgi:hypothetical protein
VSRGTQGTRRSQIAVVYRAVTVYGRSFQIVRLANWFVTPCDGPYNPGVQALRFGLFRVRSPLLAESLTCFLFLWVLRWFTSPRCLHTAYGFSGGSFGINQRGFPHSEIPGSKLVCSSPGLIAAYRVLHRLLAPRHSPYALSSLTIRNSNLRTSLPALRLRVAFVEFHAHCVSTYALTRFGGLNVWSEKTTVCRIFSCQRSLRGKYRPHGTFGDRGALSPGPLRSLTRGAQSPTPFARVNHVGQASQPA